MKRFLALYLPVQELKLLRSIALYCLKYAPFVGVEEGVTRDNLEKDQLARGLILDISGMSLLYPAEELLAKNISLALTDRNIPVSIGIASTIGAAWALSRFSNKQISIHSTTTLRALLAPLPLAALRLTAKEIIAINEVGFFSIGDLLSITSKQLGNRFGLHPLKRLDQAFGRVAECLRLIKPPDKVSAMKRFENALQRRESLSCSVEYLLKNIFKQLQEKALKASSFRIQFTCEKHQGHRQILTRDISLHLASDNFSHIQSIVAANLERLAFPVGVIEVGINAMDLTPHTYSQSAMLNSDAKLSQQTYDEEKCLAQFLDTVGAKLGSSAICQAAFCASYIPENSFRFNTLRKQLAQSRNTSASIQCMQDRPSQIFAPPEPIRVIAMLPDQPPSWLHWRGKAFKTLAGIGPERINAEWWTSSLSDSQLQRDYFRVQDELGRWLWVFRESSSLQWFIHGIWA